MYGEREHEVVTYLATWLNRLTLNTETGVSERMEDSKM